MSKSININNYADGYNIDHINCVDLVIAAASGFYHYENYYYYSFYYTFFNNWNNILLDDFLQSRNYILAKFGLYLKSNPVSSPPQLLDLIRQKINEEIPILVMARYKDIFYARQYRDENNDAVHGLFVSEYDDQKSVFAIQEFIHTRQAISTLVRGDLFSRLQLKQEMLFEIWENSNRDFQNIEPRFYNTVFTLEKNGYPQINSYHDLFQDIFLNCNCKRSYLLEVFDDFNQNVKTTSDREKSARKLTKRFNAPLLIIFDGIEKAYLEKVVNKENLKDYFNFKIKYMNYRKFFIAKLVANTMRKITFSEEEMLNIHDEMSLLDKEFFLLVQDLVENSSQNPNESQPVNGEINQALSSIITADSGDNFVYHVIRDSEEFWRSDFTNTAHWIIIDLVQPKLINKAIIKHFGTMEFNTRDYQIQGSHDGMYWETLVAVRDNIANETSHFFRPVLYRYFRLWITYPSLIEERARIRKIELWGGKVDTEKELSDS